MKVKHSFLILLGILLCASAIQAEPLADFYNDETLSSRVISLASGDDGSYTQDQDLSIHFLRMLFGPVSSLNGYNMIIGKVFELFNYGLLGIVSFIVGYTILTSVIGTAQDSGGAFSTRVSPWTIARTSSGVTLMFPMKSGYSIVQTMVMKIILMGIAFANTGWNAALSHLQERGNSFQVAPVATVDASDISATQSYEVIGVPSTAAEKVIDRLKELNPYMSYSPEVKLLIPNLAGKSGDGWVYGVDPTKPIQNFAKMVGQVVQKLVGVTVYDKESNLKSGCVDDEQVKNTKKAFKFLSDAYLPLYKLRHKCIAEDNCKEGALIFKVESTSNGYEVTFSDNNTYTLSSSYTLSLPDNRTLYTISNDNDYKNLMDGTLRQAFNTLLTLSDIHKIGRSEDPDTRLNDQARQEFAQMYSCPVNDQNCEKQEGEAYQKINQKRQAVLRKIRSQAEFLAGMAANVIDSSAAISTSDWYSSARKTGWLSSGIYYAKLMGPSGTNANEDESTLFELNGKVNDFGMFDSPVLSVAIGTWIIAADQAHETCVIKGSMMGSILFPDEVINPLIMIRDIGKTMIRESINYYADTIQSLFDETKKLADGHFAATSVTSATAAGLEAAMAGGPFAGLGAGLGAAAEITISGLKMAFNGTKIALEMFVPVGTAVAGVFFSLGVLLAVYIPMLPFVLFLFGVVAWLMSVTEAMVAAPLVALGMTHPEGHDLLGKSEQALILLLGVFIRPITMLFGILMAIIASQILVKLFHLSFGAVAFSLLVEGPPGSDEPITGMAVVAGGVLLVYVYVLMSVIEQSFSLIYVIPERILRWIGGPQDQTGIGQLAEKAKGETQQAAGQVQAASVSGPQVAAVDGKVGSGPESQAEKDDDDSSTVTGKGGKG